ncbi:MAG: YfhO family protein [Candidatus Melainabacteria bacterium]|nr:YfhO family protein [Candidatus Melainabacteria bacterium]
MCPFNLWYLELASGPVNSLFPFLCWLFARASQSPSWRKFIIAGGGMAVVILSGHPESAFFAIGFASLLSLIMTAQPFGQNASVPLIVRLYSTIGGLAITYLSASCLAAPVLLPFAEYLLNSDSYKFAAPLSQGVPWLGVMLNILHPGFAGASPYLGIIVAAMLPLAAFCRPPAYNKVITLSLCALTAFFTVTQMWPFSLVLHKQPFSSLVTVYCLFVLLLFLALLAAFGLQEACQELQCPDKRWLTLCFTSLAVITVPFILRALHISLRSGAFDSALPDMSISVHALVRDAVLLLLVLTLLMVKQRKHRLIVRASWTVPWLCVCLSFASQASIAKASLPNQPLFEYPKLELLDKLTSPQFRMLATGDHLFRPNTNIVYGINDIRTHNPMFPRRYLNFIRLLGARTDTFRQVFDSRLPTTIDMAAVAYVLSQQGLLSQEESLPQSINKHIVQVQEDLFPGLTLIAKNIVYDALNREILGSVDWHLTDKKTSSYKVCFVLLNSADQVLWFGDLVSLVTDGHTNITTTLPGKDNLRLWFSLPVPQMLHNQGKVSIGIQVFDKDAIRLVNPKPGLVRLVDHVALLGQQDLQDCLPALEIQHRHFKLVQDTKHKARLYKNPHAVERTYLVHKIIRALSKEDALRKIAAKTFDCHSQVVLEGLPEGYSIPVNDQPNNISTDNVVVQRADPAYVKLHALASVPGFVVLTDTFYPGWRAFVDGQETTIFQANYLFRAVAVSAGSHTVEFRYEPQSFWCGVILCGAFLLVVSLAIWANFLKSTQGVGKSLRGLLER